MLCATPKYVVVGRGRRSVCNVVCEAKKERMEKLKEFAKHSVTERRQNCAKAIAAFKIVLDSEHALQGKLREELAAIVKQDMQRVKDMISVRVSDTNTEYYEPEILSSRDDDYEHDIDASSG